MNSVSWHVLAEEAPDIAAFGVARIDGKVAYLATVNTSGEPRIHPVTPIVGFGRCIIFAEPESSKLRHFSENTHYSLHCSMSDSSGSSGEFRIYGEVTEIVEPSLREQLESACSFLPSARSKLFELLVSGAMTTNYRSGRPSHRRWTGPA